MAESPEGSLEGELVSFSYRAEDGSFAVGKLRRPMTRDTVVVGPIGHVLEGQHVSLDGKWSEHAQFGRQFRVRSVLVDDPRTLRGLERYLGSGAVKGLGPTFAKRVVETHGLDTLRIIEEEPKKLLEVQGIGKKRLDEIVEHYEKDRRDRRIMATLRGYDIGQGLASRIVERFGDEAAGIVDKEPYRLLEIRGIGFVTADKIALENGVAPDAPQRVGAALNHLLSEAAAKAGHCNLPQDELLARCRSLDIPDDPAHEQVELAVLQGRLVRTKDDGSPRLALPALARAEIIVASRLRELAESQRQVPGAVDEVSGRLGLELNEGQREAVELALERGVAVITGGPGTGKTTIVKVLTALGRRRKETWLLAAPTGRAARRLAEATGQEAKTIHRLLEYRPGGSGFARHGANPLEADGVLIDETSMVDIHLMASLVEAIPRGCHLVLVGDADQLPSVGPGNVLGDVIASGAIVVAQLTEVYRQAQDSGIVMGAHRINQGEAPVGGEAEPGIDDFFIVGRSEPQAAVSALLQIVGKRLPAKGFDPMKDVQVLTPMHQGMLGTLNLNQKLQAMLNPGNGTELKRGNTRIRPGDRVLQMRNNYDLDVFNGDVGTVLSVEGGGVVVEFEGRDVAYTGNQVDDLDLAYAISIHKSQGSEYPAVVIAIHRQHRIMLRRNLVYTAVTRARRFCCLVGDPWAIHFAASQVGGSTRHTRLAALLAD